MLEKIIESCYYVTNNAKDVFINYDVLDNFILNIDCNNLKNWLSYNYKSKYNLLFCMFYDMGLKSTTYKYFQEKSACILICSRYNRICKYKKGVL